MSATSRPRHESRERAIGFLYEAEQKEVEVESVLAELPVPADELTAGLAVGVDDHRAEIDHLIGRFSRDWSLDRMAAMDRAILRLGTFELAGSDLPSAVILDEAVELTHAYGSRDDSHRFVNGVLASVDRHVRSAGGAWTPVSAVVFDMDGVVRHWTGQAAAEVERRYDLGDGAVGQVAFEPDRLRRAMTGEITRDEWADEIADGVCSAHPGVDRTAVLDAWAAPSWKIDDEMVELIRGLTDADVIVGLWSNASTGLEADLDRIGIGDLFDVVANSSRFGLVKPDVEAFAAVTGTLGVPPERTWFTDDRPENVAGALAAGWHAFGHSSPARTRRVLSRLTVG